MTEDTPKLGVSRRTLAKGAAWSVPAVAVAAAAPAYAGSGSKPSVKILSACKQPGSSCFKDYAFRKGYTFLVEFTNTTNQDIYIYLKATAPLDPYVTITSSKNFDYEAARYFSLTNGVGTFGGPVGDYLLVPKTSTVLIAINAADSNSSNTAATVDMFFAWGHTVTPGEDKDHPYTPVPTASNIGTEGYGEGWTGARMYFSSFPPCGTDCAPGGDATETGDLVAPAATEETAPVANSSNTTDASSERQSSTAQATEPTAPTVEVEPETTVDEVESESDGSTPEATPTAESETNA